MRILALDRSGLYFGSAYNLIQWAEHYIENGHSVDLLLGEDGDFRNKAEAIGVGVNVDNIPNVINNYGKKNLKLSKIPVIFFAWLKFNIHLCFDHKLRGYDLYIANNYRTYVYYFIFFLVARMQGCKTILRYQTSDTPISIFRKISHKVFSSIIIHGTEGYAIEKFGRRYVSEANVFYLPNPVDTNKFKPLEVRDEVRELFGIPSNSFVFISVSYIEPRKGVYELVKTFSELNLDNTYLVHVGDAGEHVEYESRVKSMANENVKFLGRREDIPQLLNMADAFVLYSEYEGMPYVVVEAMACGLPVLASDAGSNEEVLEELGVVVKWGDISSLRRELSGMVVKNNYNLKKKIISRVENLYSVKAYFELLDDIYGINK